MLFCDSVDSLVDVLVLCSVQIENRGVNASQHDTVFSITLNGWNVDCLQCGHVAAVRLRLPSAAPRHLVQLIREGFAFRGSAGERGCIRGANDG